MEKTTKTDPPKNVDEYLASLPDAMRAVMEKARQSIKSAAPKAEEVISYRIPTYKLNGALVHLAAFKNHCSLIVVSKPVMETFQKELQVYETTGVTIHFTPDKPLPATLVKKIVKTRIKENEKRISAKKK